MEVLVVLLLVVPYLLAVFFPEAVQVAIRAWRAEPEPRFDRVRAIDVSGRLVEAVDPPWWRIDRWIAWWSASVDDKVEVTFSPSRRGIVKPRRVRGIVIDRRR